MLLPAILVRARESVYLPLRLKIDDLSFWILSHNTFLSIRRAGQSNLNVHSDKRGRPTKPPGWAKQRLR